MQHSQWRLMEPIQSYIFMTAQLLNGHAAFLLLLNCDHQFECKFNVYCKLAIQNE